MFAFLLYAVACGFVVSIICGALMNNSRCKMALTVLVAIVVMAAAAGCFAEETYNRVGFICDIDEDNDLIIIMDSVGLIWEWEGIEDFDIYDAVVFNLYPQGKPEYILDDVMGQPTYTGIHLDMNWVQTMLETYYN